MIDQLETEVRELFAEQAAAVPLASVRKVAGIDYHPRSPRRLMPITAGVSALAAAGVCALAITATTGSDDAPASSHDQSGAKARQVDPAPHATRFRADSVELAGYSVHLPAGYRHVRTASTCTDDLVSRTQAPLVVTPSGGCPLVIDAVLPALPANATAHSVNADTTPVTFYSVTNPATGTTGYFPARLTGGQDVYVSIGYGHATINVQQAAQLAAGLDVTPAGPCTGPDGCG